MSFLRDLDEKYVPRLAESLDRTLRRLPGRAAKPAPAGATRPAAGRGAPAAAGLPADGPAPVVVRLRELDDRYAARGPLALLREVPQVGAVAVTAMLLASSITWYSRRMPEPPPGAQIDIGAIDEDGFSDGTLGPEIDERVPTYVKMSNDRLRRLGVERPDGMVVAVISFTEYLTPEQARELLGVIQVRQVFYRPPVPTGVVQQAGVADLVADTERIFRQAAALRAAELKELRKVTATIENDPAQKADQEKDIRDLTREVRMLRGKCRCVFAVVVLAQLRLLLDALNVNGIRVVDVSEIGADFANLTYSALLPEERMTVTGGNEDLQ